MKDWKLYGDMHPMEHDGVFIKSDKDNGCFIAVGVTNLDNHGVIEREETFLISDCYIDLHEDWIDWEAVSATHGTCIEDYKTDSYIAVYDLISYYGTFEFGDETKVVGYDNAIQELHDRGITWKRGE